MRYRNWNEKGERKFRLSVLALLILVLAAIHFFDPTFYPTIYHLSKDGDLRGTIAYLHSFGIYAAFMSFFIDVVINIVGFLPSIFISTANGLIFGLFWGVIISWLAETVGVLISFYVMRTLFRGMAMNIINKSKTVAIFINQIREKVGVLFGSPETTSGGRALKFYATIRLDVRRVDQIKQGSDAIGNLTRVKVVKNKVAPPFKTAEVDLIYGKGISHEGEVLDLATNLDIVEKSGAWFSYNGDRLGQGRENVKELLKQNPELTSEIEQKVREKMLG